MADFDLKINDGSSTRRFRLLQRQGQKFWQVQEQPPRPQVEGRAAAREGLPPDRMLPFDGQDFSWGAGLARFTPQGDRPGHVLRYADGFGVDTTEPGRVKHGPLVSSVGSTAANVLKALVFVDVVWFMTESHLYTWDGCTLTLEWTNCGDDNTDMEVFNGNLFVAAGASYFWTDGTGVGGCVTMTEESFAATKFLALNGVLWRSFSQNQISSSNTPADCCPVWTAGAEVGDGDTIRNLFSISGLLGVETFSNLFVIDSDLSSIELNKGLRNRRATASTTAIKSESGGDVWFSDGINVWRLVSVGFELFDVGPDGPFHSTDERPVTEFPAGGAVVYTGIAQDLDEVYVAVLRAQGDYIYKGKPVTRNVFAWTPLVKESAGTVTFLAVLKTSADTAPIVYFNDGTSVKQFSTVWSTYAPAWELETVRFNATLPAWAKMWYRIRATLELAGCDTDVTVSERRDTDISYNLFGATGVMSDGGSNEITVTAPLNGNEIQLKFAGATCTDTNNADLLSFLLEGLLRPDYRRTYDFSIIADSQADATFIEGLRTGLTSFVTLTDRFGTDRTVFVLPGYPIEQELEDQVRKEVVRVYRIVAQELG